MKKKGTEAPCELLQEAKHRLGRVVHEVRDRTEGMMAECVTLVKQVMDGTLLDERH